MQYTAAAPMFVSGRWRVIRWTAPSDGNKHSFVMAKAAEVGATGWDVGQTEYAEADRFPRTR